MRSWLSLYLSDDAVRAADAAAAALGGATHAQLLAAGDSLAQHSDALALVFYRQAARAWLELGPDAFTRWLALGAALLTGTPSCKAGAASYFALPPTAFGPGGLDTAAAWCTLGREVTQLARHLGRVFFERTASVLASEPDAARLSAWTAAGLELARRDEWQARSLADVYFESAPASVTLLAHPGRWVAVAAALAEAIDPRAFFAAPPAAWPQLSVAAQALFLDAIARFAAEDKTAAGACYRELPAALARLHASAQQALLALIAQLDLGVVIELADLAPSLSSTLAAVPRDRVDAALAQVASVAELQPLAAVAALRSLPELYRSARPTQVAHWFADGLRLTADNPAAAHAFFALQSRTSVKLLRAASSAVELDDELGLWRKLAHMLSGEPAVIRRLDTPSLRPPLEPLPEDDAVAMPSRIDWLPSYAQNRDVFRFLVMQLAGRREFGSYAFRAPDGRDLYAYLRGQHDTPTALEQLFLVAEAVRVQHRIALAYPGTVQDTQRLASDLLTLWQDETQPTHDHVCDVLLALALAPSSQRPVWLPLMAAEQILPLLATLQHSAATVERAIDVARQLFALLATPVLLRAGASLGAEKAGQSDAVGLSDLASDRAPEPSDAELQRSAEGVVGAQPPGADAKAQPQLQPVHGQPRGGSSETSDATVIADEPDDEAVPGPMLQRARRRPASAQTFLYDEWDHTIGDYRSRHCRVHEIAVPSDSGAFFERTVAGYANVLTQVRRQFERMRPERYRPLRGLEDGEDFDLNALTDARIEARARRTPSTRIYTARTRQTRDVATLFLLDMSASTEQPYADRGDEPRTRRIIDTLKEALVVMSTALDHLGDSYAIYGFSSQGHDQVEVYPVKTFGETLSASAKARIGGIEPKSGTRMGAALRHTLTKFAAVHARSKHLILLSDGFPQDQDYGPDRRSNTYGIEDTAVALRELSAAGTTPLCLTVDRAGHDYLRRMCDASQYLVIDEVEGLPRELPKIYRRVVLS